MAKSLLAIARQAKKAKDARQKKAYKDECRVFDKKASKIRYQASKPINVRCETIADLLASLGDKRTNGRLGRLDSILEETLKASGLKAYLKHQLDKNPTTDFQREQIKEKLIKATKPEKVESREYVYIQYKLFPK